MGKFKFDWLKIQEFYDEGHSLKECMDQFGFSRGAWKRARHNGYVVPDPTRASKFGLPARTREVCLFDGCAKFQYYSYPYCELHHKRIKRHGNPTLARAVPKICSVEDCDNKSHCKNMCELHYRRWKKHGNPLPLVPKRRGSGGTIVRDGYRKVVARGHPNAGPNGKILEHRLIMSNYLGRALSKGENVHHINGDKLDNRIENLELWVSSQPSGQRVQDLMQWAWQIIDTYMVEYPLHQGLSIDEAVAALGVKTAA